MDEIEVYQAHIRDQGEKDNLITQHLQERQQLQRSLKRLSAQQQEDIQQLTNTVFSNLPKNKQEKILCDFNKVQIQSQARGFDLGM